ncbi:MAG TPA: hypothetical protein VND94_18870 [Terriglobia bacterium]|nr:hypothetical protein [Terriglobia bacterium]
MPTINTRLVEVALTDIGGADFENFFHEFYVEFGGADYIPLGGMHDGGADAFESPIYEKAGKATVFYQASVEEDAPGKIRRTVTRIRKFGRTPRTLTYFSSRDIPNADLLEENLSEELDITVRIRARKWISVNINKSHVTQAAFENHLLPRTAFLQEIGAPHLIERAPIPNATAICVFLGQEIDRRRSNSDLLTSIVDSLILWSLGDTDPQQGKFLTAQEIVAKIEAALPTAKKFIRGSIKGRLDALSSKRNNYGREITRYKQVKYCLPFSTRELIKNENIEDEGLRIAVLDGFRQRAAEYAAKEGLPISTDDTADLAMSTIQRVFEREGLQFAQFFADGAGDVGANVADRIDDTLAEAQIGGGAAIDIKAGLISILRPAFYQSSPSEREYFGKLSRTYALLFSLRVDPEIINYFRGMSSKFVLYVGADLLIQSMSERYLRQEDQMATNMLRIVREAGSTLILGEPSLEEVKGHLIATDTEFRALFAPIEAFVDKEHARHASKPLIRTYFYSKLSPLDNIRPPAGWKSYLGMFCSYDELHSEKGKQELKLYLLDKYQMQFESNDDLAALVDNDDVTKLAKKIRPNKRDEILAINDARQILAVYGKRAKLGEEHRPNPFGYKTWWLTHESFVRQHTGELVAAHNGAQYILRPEFLLNFIALSPKMEEVRQAYREIFPSILGMTLSNRMRENVFKDVLKRVRDIQDNDPSRMKVIMADLANKLKSDQFKMYEHKLGAGLLD